MIRQGLVPDYIIARVLHTCARLEAQDPAAGGVPEDGCIEDRRIAFLPRVAQSEFPTKHGPNRRVQ